MNINTRNKRVYIRTFGCQMNERDSEFIAGFFLENRYRLVDSPNEADVVLFNTCSVRKHAEDRAISNMGYLTHRNGNRIYGIVGCAAQALGDELFCRLPGLNIVCGTGEIARLPELVERVAAGDNKVLALENKDALLPEEKTSYRKDSRTACVSIMRGCNNYCSYCVVPYVRGRERSRKAADIVKEIKGLAARGICEVTLLGQNVNSYHDKSGEACDFVRLLEIINGIEGLSRISFMTSHPKDTNARLFEAMRDLNKVVKHLHLPLQSGSDRILQLMKRGYTRADCVRLSSGARKIIPDLRLTTDIIVGFPTETDGDFKDTLDLLKESRFDLAYIFKYSPRPGTEASRMADDVSEGIKKERHKILLDLQKDLSRRKTNEKPCSCSN